jgi:Glyoxalase-like domain
VAGGRHPGWGTANRIVPLGETYLELVAVVDEAEAAQSAFGRRVAGVHPEPSGQPFGWVVRTNQLDEVAHRLGLTVEAGSRAAPSG